MVDYLDHLNKFRGSTCLQDQIAVSVQNQRRIQNDVKHKNLCGDKTSKKCQNSNKNKNCRSYNSAKICDGKKRRKW